MKIDQNKENIRIVQRIRKITLTSKSFFFEKELFKKLTIINFVFKCISITIMILVDWYFAFFSIFYCSYFELLLLDKYETQEPVEIHPFF